MPDTEHLDKALAEEFAGHGDTIHFLKVSDPHFRDLMERNHALWTEIKHIHDGIAPADDARRRDLEKQRLALLDKIGVRIRAHTG